MSPPNPGYYQFGPFRLHVFEGGKVGRLTRLDNGEEEHIPVTQRPFEFLLALVQLRQKTDKKWSSKEFDRGFGKENNVRQLKYELSKRLRYKNGDDYLKDYYIPDAVEFVPRTGESAGTLAKAAGVIIPSVCAVVITLVLEVAARVPLAAMRLTLTQAMDAGAVSGLLQGIIGSILWAVPIGGTISIWLLGFADWPRWNLANPRRRATLIGGASGLLGGAIVTLSLVFGQEPETLAKAGWIQDQTRLTAFTVTGLGYSELVNGLALGGAVGFCAARVLLSSHWGIIVATHSKIAGVAELPRALRSSLIQALKQSHVLLLMMAIAASLVDGVVSVFFARRAHLRIIGEALCIGAGGLGMVSGLLFGLFLVRTGVRIHGRD